VKTKCKECEADLELPDDTTIGEIIDCSDCGESYEVEKINPDNVVLKKAESVGEDWGE
jgi:alpha-aminoadipate carrier protein LysW